MKWPDTWLFFNIFGIFDDFSKVESRLGSKFGLRAKCVALADDDLKLRKKHQICKTIGKKMKKSLVQLALKIFF